MLAHLLIPNFNELFISHSLFSCFLSFSHPLHPSLFSSFFENHFFFPPIILFFSLSFSLIKAGNKPPPATPGKPKKATTFQEFESITSDAWDVGDDDDELLAMAAQNLNIEVVMETANKVNYFKVVLPGWCLSTAVAHFPMSV